MRCTSVTIGVPVRDLDTACRWYESLLEREGPDLRPAPGIVEYEVGGCWLQLFEGEAGAGGWVLRIGVPELGAERRRLIALGIAAGEVVEIEGVIAFCDLRDPDGNRLSLYTVPTPA